MTHVRVTTQMSVVCSREVGSSSLVVVIKDYYYCIVLLSSKSWKLKHNMLQLHDASSSLGFRVGSSTNIYPLTSTHIHPQVNKKGVGGFRVGSSTNIYPLTNTHISSTSE
jgi:hypothetical protein